LLPNELRFPLPQNNYEDVRDANAAVPKILVAVQVPDDDPPLWLVSSAEDLELYRAAWWVSLPGFPANQRREHREEWIQPPYGILILHERAEELRSYRWFRRS
jgi:hypothetical protein